MSTAKPVVVQPVRFEQAQALIIAGLGARFNQSSIAGIPALWQRFGPYIGTLPGQVGDFTYGVCYQGDGKGNFDYLAGVQVNSVEILPAGFSHIELKPQRYAVFEHHGSLDSLKDTFQAIWREWLPGSGERAAQAPEFERYGKGFDPFHKRCVMEIWLPLEWR